MTDLTREQIEALLERADRYATSIPTTDNYRFLLVSDLIAALRSTMTALAEAQAAQAGVVQCCMCGKKGLSTAEDGGPECELHDGRWVCSRKCWEVASDLADPTGVALLAELRARAERADELGKRLGRRIHAQRVRLRQMEGFKCRCCDLMALRLQRLKRSNEYRARAEAAEAQLAEAQKREAGLTEALKKYRNDLCEGYCGEDEWSDAAHHHPDCQRDCGGCLAASVLLKNAALSAAPTGEESNG